MFEGDDGAQFQCSVVVERLNSSGQATKRQVIRKAAVLLGRNEFQEIILRVHDGKVPQSYTLKEFQLFTRFVKDGKCTVKLLPENIQVLISDCPPHLLNIFLKTLSIKHQAWQTSKPVTDREKLKACLPRSFETISPLQQKDIQKANELRSKVNAPVLSRGLVVRTGNKMTGGPQGEQVKRPRTDCDSSPVSSYPQWLGHCSPSCYSTWFALNNPGSGNALHAIQPSLFITDLVLLDMVLDIKPIFC